MSALVSRAWSAATVGVAALAILVCTNGPVFYVGHLAGRPQGSWDDFRVRFPFAAVAAFGVAALGVVLHRSSVLPRGRVWWRAVPVLAIVAYGFLGVASTLWSELPSVTLPRALIYVGLGAFAIWFGRLHGNVQLDAVAIAMAVAVVASVVVVYVDPEVGRMVADGRGIGWKGIFTNRNSLAPVAGLGLLTTISITADGRRQILVRLGWLVVALLEAVVLYKSQSDTARAAFGIAVGIGGLLFLARRFLTSRRLTVASVIGAVVVVLVINAKYDLIVARVAQLAGRSLTLSSRTIIWVDVVEAIRARPLLGYGIFTFWDVPALTAKTYANVGSGYAEAHNGLLEVALGLGAVGVALLLVIVAFAVVGNGVRYVQRPSAQTWWWVTAATYFVLLNVTESFVLWFSYVWILLLAAAVASTRPDDEAQPPA